MKIQSNNSFMCARTSCVAFVTLEKHIYAHNTHKQTRARTLQRARARALLSLRNQAIEIFYTWLRWMWKIWISLPLPPVRCLNYSSYLQLPEGAAQSILPLFISLFCVFAFFTYECASKFVCHPLLQSFISLSHLTPLRRASSACVFTHSSFIWLFEEFPCIVYWLTGWLVGWLTGCLLVIASDFYFYTLRVRHFSCHASLKNPFVSLLVMHGIDCD